VCELDRFHGCEAIHSAATGRFRTAQIDGVWWLITPEGNAFFSAGVNHTSSDGDYAPALGRSPYHDKILELYGSERAWADSVVERFAALGLNTIGAWSSYDLFAGRVPYTVILGFAGRAPEVPGVAPGITGLRVRDYFAPEFISGAAAEAQGALGCAADTFCIGAFSDNELGWGSGLAQSVPFLDAYLRLPAGGPGKVALQVFFEQLYGGDVAAFNAVWGQQLTSFDDVQALRSLPRSPMADPPARTAARQAFAGSVAQRYYQVVHDALRAVSPDLLILGSRLLAYHSSPAVIAASAPFVDVVSVNQYEVVPAALDLLVAAVQSNGYIVTGDLFADLDELYRLAQKPLLISEFGYRAADSGLPNSYPPLFPVLATQAERAAAYEQYMRHVLARPYLVGAHWFEYADEPAEGRFDGENDNWGIVNINDVEYPELAAHMQLLDSVIYQR
jgi:agarase